MVLVRESFVLLHTFHGIENSVVILCFCWISLCNGLSFCGFDLCNGYSAPYYRDHEPFSRCSFDGVGSLFLPLLLRLHVTSHYCFFICVNFICWEFYM